MMLRRTRAKQVAPVYELFIRDYPSPDEMYRADSNSLRSSLKPLGLNWRIAQFEALGRDLVRDFGGHVPTTREELVQLTGVSDYVADAVLVFALGQPRAVIDANVARVIARYFGLREHAEARRDGQVRELADGLLDRAHARDYNFAMLDLAALVCTARNPKHDLCPLRRTCAKAANAKAVAS
ncbi:MAG: DNA glycosylase [Chloroflexi bacterium]|nr:DNA glycosylase [Chloroflexota bacterium]